MIEVFDEHIVLYYEVTCQKQSLKQFWVLTFASMKHFPFSKLLWSAITGFKIQKVKFFFVKMSYSFYSFIIHFRSDYTVKESLWCCSQLLQQILTFLMTSITRLQEMIPQPAFRYYSSLLQRRQAAAAKVLNKMHTSHPPCRSSCYASLISYIALLPTLAPGCLLYV